HLLLSYTTDFFSLYAHAPPPDLYSFPTRRSSDLLLHRRHHQRLGGASCGRLFPPRRGRTQPCHDVLRTGAYQVVRDRVCARLRADRKSTRLNSSHDQISYAVFCLKKKNEHTSLRE